MLQNKTGIVTGGAAGIGLACAELFLKEGAKVVIADWHEEAGQKAVEYLKKISPHILFQRCDVGDKTQVDDLVSKTVQEFGHIDFLVNNAGIIHSAEFLDLREEDFDRVLRVNLKGMFLVGQAVAKTMVDHKTQGAIINMSSVNGVLAIPNQVPYVVSKGGTNQLTKVMALGLAPYGIRVNAIGPGSIMTDILKGVANNPEAMQRILSRTPLGRVGEPEEIAQIALFLASPASSYITGQIIYADGGRLALNYTVPVPNL